MREPSDRRPTWRVFLALLIGGLAACAPTVRLTTELRSSIRTIRIAGEVTLYGAILIDQPTLFSPAVSLDAPGYDQARLERTMRESGIEIGRIVRAELARELVASGAFELVEGVEADARLEVDLAAAGYGPANPFVYHRRRPRLNLWARLVRESDGVLLATSRSFVTAANREIPAHTLEELVDEPELIRAGFTTVARILSARVVRDLRAR